MNKCQLPSCGKTIPKKARNQKYCSPEHMQEHLAEKKTTASPLSKEIRRAPVDTVEFTVSPELQEQTGLPEKVELPKSFVDNLKGPSAVDLMAPDRQAAAKITDLPEDKKLHVDFVAGDGKEVPVVIGGVPYAIGDQGVRQLDPITQEDMDAFNELREQQNKEFRDALTQKPANSHWQGDAPEGTLAFKLKYGVWYKKDLP